MFKEQINSAKSSLEKTIKICMTSMHSLISHVPYEKYAMTCMVPRKNKKPCHTCSQGLPVPPETLLQKYSLKSFLESGENHVKQMKSILEKSELGILENERILDFGCASGRMIRWLYPYVSTCEIWGVDVNSNNLMWCRNYLTPPFKFSTSTRMPHLPFEDGYFSFVYACSVFSHIEELADTWLLELRRITAPEGRLYITIHDNNTIRLLKDECYQDHWFNDCMRGNQALADKFDEYAAKDFGMFSILRSNAPHLNLETTPNVYYDINYFSDLVSPFFTIISITPEAYGYQTAVLLQKK